VQAEHNPAHFYLHKDLRRIFSSLQEIGEPAKGYSGMPATMKCLPASYRRKDEMGRRSVAPDRSYPL
jgi:hypothetical protein